MAQGQRQPLKLHPMLIMKKLSKPQSRRIIIEAAAATPTDAATEAQARRPKGGQNMTHATGSALRAALRGTLGALLVALLGTLAGVAHAVPVGATAPATGVLEIVTVPAVPGARFAVDGRTHRANQQGVVRVKVSSKGRHKIATVDNKISQQDRTLEFVRWYHGNHQKDYLHS